MAWAREIEKLAMRKWIWRTLIIAAVFAAGVLLSAWFWLQHARGFSAHAQPTSMEVMMAHMMRDMAMPAKAARMKNPYPATAATIEMASQHFAAHCALCHNNNGDGKTDLGKDMYPHPPNLAGRQTQTKSDGELFYAIRNGIRMSGMPAWPEDSRREIWELVNFIRNLPRQTPQQRQEMKRYNPKTIFPEPIM